MPSLDLTFDVRALLGHLDGLTQLVAAVQAQGKTLRRHANKLLVARVRLSVHARLIRCQTALISEQNRTIARQTDEIADLREQIAAMETRLRRVEDAQRCAPCQRGGFVR